MEVIAIHIKPISNNLINGVTKKGRVYKKKEAREFEDNVLHLLKKHAWHILIPTSRDLELITRFYVSRKFDTSNCLKLLEDCIARHFKINDRRFAGHKSSRVVVKPGKEKIEFVINSYNDADYSL